MALKRPASPILAAALAACAALGATPARASGPAEGTPAFKVWLALRAVHHNRPGDPQSLRARGAASETLEVTEAQLNDYLAWEIERGGHGVRSARVAFLGDKLFRVEVVSELGPEILGRLDERARGWVEKGVVPLLGKEGRLEVLGFFTSARGKGFYQTREARIKGVRVPDALVREAMELAGPRLRPPVDFNRLFDLPNGIEKAEVLQGAVRVRLRPL